MAATKQIPAAPVNLLLNNIATGIEVLHTNLTTNPTTRAAALAAALLQQTVTAGAGNGSWVLGSGASIQCLAATTPVTATASTGGNGAAGTSQTASCIVVTDGTNILMITTGSTVITSGQQYTPGQFTYTFNQPT